MLDIADQPVAVIYDSLRAYAHGLYQNAFSVFPSLSYAMKITAGILAFIVFAQLPLFADTPGFSPFAIVRVDEGSLAAVDSSSHIQPTINARQLIEAIRSCRIPDATSEPVGAGHMVRNQQAERTLGNKLALELEQKRELITDSVTSRYLNRIEQTIVRSSALVGCFTVKLVDDPEPNAYSLPGGYIYVTTGLIVMADTEAQLAAALAHETGHVTARHYIKIFDQRRRWGRLALVGGPFGYLIRRSIGTFITMKLLRNAEFEADGLGLKYQNAAGYDPIEVSRLLQRVFDEETPESFVERLSDTHPPTSTRIGRLNKAMRHLLPAEGAYTVDTSDFHEIKARVSALTSLAGPANREHLERAHTSRAHDSFNDNANKPKLAGLSAISLSHP